MKNKLIHKEYYLLKLNKKSLRALIAYIDYCYHRATKHKTPLSPFADNIEKLKYLLKNSLKNSRRIYEK